LLTLWVDYKKFNPSNPCVTYAATLTIRWNSSLHLSKSSCSLLYRSLNVCFYDPRSSTYALSLYTELFFRINPLYSRGLVPKNKLFTKGGT